MARIFKRPGDPHWWLDVTINGRRRRVKTSTTSKRAAEALLAEREAANTRIALGLEAVTYSKFRTVAEAWRHWLENWCPPASLRREKSRFHAHVEKNAFGDELLTAVTGARIDAWLDERAKARKAGKRTVSNSPTTLNGHRRILRAVYNALIRHRYYRGFNPVKETSPREQVEYAYELLEEDQIRRVLAHLNPAWREMTTLSWTCGLRRGEVFALRKSPMVIDFRRRMLTVRASNANNKAKGKKVRSIPLFDEALAVLRVAWDRTQPGGLLFPSPRGPHIMRSANTRGAERLRSAMARAGLADSWDHRCVKRNGCGFELLNQPDGARRRCPKCAHVMLATANVRRVRYHDVRHSFAVYLLDRGVDLLIVSKLLRHSNIDITEKTYAHRNVEKVRSAVKLALNRHQQTLAHDNNHEGEASSEQ